MKIRGSANFVFVWLVYILQCYCGAAESECDRASKSEIFTLKKNLFCSYDPQTRPVKVENTTTNVSAHLWVKYVYMDEDNGVLDIHSWIVWRWKDEHLTWDKNEYNGLESLHVLSSEIWSPDITVAGLSRIHMNNVATSIPQTMCLLNYKGDIVCVSPTQNVADCDMDTARWPFDSCKCRMRMGSWTNSAKELNITIDKEGINQMDYTKNREWELIRLNASVRGRRIANTSSYISVRYSFEMRRHPGGHASSVITPSIVLAVMTLVSFWLDPARPARIGLICSNIFCHCLFLFLLNWLLPKNGDVTPIIVTFFRDSLVLAGISLLVSVSAANMTKAARAPPVWITFVTDAAMTSTHLQFCLPSETDLKDTRDALGAETDGENPEVTTPSKKTSGWRVFAALIDRFLFVVFTLTFTILLCAYIP